MSHGRFSRPVDPEGLRLALRHRFHPRNGWPYGDDGGDTGTTDPGYPTQPIQTAPTAASADPTHVRAVIDGVDSLTSPAYVSVLPNNETPAENGFTVPANLGMKFAVAPTNGGTPPVGTAYVNNPTNHQGGSWCTVNMTTREVVSIDTAVSTSAPVDYSKLFQYIQHNGAFNAQGFQNPGYIDQTQLLVGALNVTPNVTNVGAFSANQSSSSSIDYYNGTWTTDSVGTTASKWLAQIYLVSSVKGLNRWGINGIVVPNASGSYTGTWRGIPCGADQYDLGIVYVDPASNLSNVKILGTITPGGIPTAAYGRIPGTGPSFVAGTPAYSYTGPNSYTINLPFTGTNLANATGVSIYYTVHGQTTPVYNVQTLPLQASGNYNVTFAGIADSTTTYDIWAAYTDATGNPGTYSNFLTTTAVTAPPAGAGGSMPAGTVCNAVNGQASPFFTLLDQGNAQGYLVQITPVTVSGVQVNPLWLADVELLVAPKGTTNWNVIGTLPPNSGGSYTWIGRVPPYSDLSMRLVDYAGGRSGACASLLTIQNYRFLQGGSGNGPSVYNVNPNITSPTLPATPTYTNAGNAAYDAKLTLTFDSFAQVATTPYLAAIELLISPAGANTWSHYGYVPGQQSSSVYTCTWANIGAGNVYDLGVRYTDTAGGVSNVVKVATTVANPLGNTVLQTMPSALKTNGPTITSASMSARTNRAGMIQSVTVTFTESDFTSSVPPWIDNIILVVRVNGDTIGGRQVFIDPRTSTTGTYTQAIPVSSGDTVDVGIMYEDISGQTSTLVWPANWSAQADPNGGMFDSGDSYTGLRWNRGPVSFRNTINSSADTFGAYIKPGQITGSNIYIPGSTGSHNYVFNPTFANGLAGYTTALNGMNTGTDGYGGGRLHVYMNGVVNNWGLVQQLMTGFASGNPMVAQVVVEIGQTALPAGTTVYLRVTDQLGNQLGISSGITSANGATRFQQFATFTVPASGQIYVQCYVNAGGTANGADIIFYKLQVEYGAVPTYWVDHNSNALVTKTHNPNGGSGLDGLLDGSMYGRPLLSRLSGGKPWIDFSEAIHLNKTQDSIADGTTYARVKGTELSSGTVARLNDGTNVRTAANLAAVVDGSNRMPNSASMAAFIPNTTAYYTDFVVNYSSSGVSPNISMKFWFDNGVSGAIKFYVPSYTSSVGDQNFSPGVNGLPGTSFWTAASPYTTITGLTSTDVIYWFIYYSKNSGWSISYQKNSPFTYAQIQAAYADGGYIATLATTNVNSSGVAAGGSGSFKGGGGHPVY